MVIGRVWQQQVDEKFLKIAEVRGEKGFPYPPTGSNTACSLLPRSYLLN
jgi:hypothetical protein